MKLAMSDNVQVVEVYPKPFDLPDGYLSFVRIFSDGHREIGGIDDQGSVST